MATSAALSLASCSPGKPGSPSDAGTPVASGPPPVLKTQVVAVYPHDPGAFTEGLEFAGPELYESVGLYNRSELRVVDMKTGTVQRRVPLPSTQWAEGMTVVDSRIWQLTYREQVALTWDRATLRQEGQATYSGEGWGLCYSHSARLLVMSNGSDRLTLRDPKTFAEQGSVQVTDPSLVAPVRLNELECVGNEVWAVVYPTPRLVRVDVSTGRVTAFAEASGLLTAEETRGVADLNGIAAVPGTDTFLITGKFWPKMFQVRLVGG